MEYAAATQQVQKSPRLESPRKPTAETAARELAYHEQREEEERGGVTTNTEDQGESQEAN